MDRSLSLRFNIGCEELILVCRQSLRNFTNFTYGKILVLRVNRMNHQIGTVVVVVVVEISRSCSRVSYSITFPFWAMT